MKNGVQDKPAARGRARRLTAQEFLRAVTKSHGPFTAREYGPLRPALIQQQTHA